MIKIMYWVLVILMVTTGIAGFVMADRLQNGGTIVIPSMIVIALGIANWVFGPIAPKRWRDE